MTRYAVDTNLYIRAFRDRQAASELERFLDQHAPHCYLHSVVLHELLVGASDAEWSRTIESAIAAPMARRRRIVTPTHRGWREAGTAVARLAGRKQIDLHSLPRSFAHDALIAAACGEAGVTLITDNERDFARLRGELHFDFVAPWP